MSSLPDYRTLSSLKNALQVLKCFTAESPEKGITEIAHELQLSKSTVHRVMATLAEEGFVTKDPKTHKYRLGLSLLSLGGVIMSHLDICREGQQLLEEFVHRFDETAHLAVLEGYSTVYVSKIECKHPVKILTHIGRRNPLHCTSSGKVILAYQAPEVIDDVIQRGLIAYTPATITQAPAFRRHLQEIREQGYAISQGELRDGVASVAVPVRDYTREVIGAVTVVGPIQRFTPERMQVFAKQLLSVGKEISARLGYYERRR
ncbi:MAG: IclR family transcriptional regulator [Alicyclobacillus sp.]|nr:IclR family transcriptional regulator [Alicyclobacillus sp.]